MDYTALYPRRCNIHTKYVRFEVFTAVNNEECRLLGCEEVWLLQEQRCQRTVSPPSSGWKKIRELGTT
jgi:hypothetical protein